MSRMITDVVARGLGAAMLLATMAGVSGAADNEKLLIPQGHSQVVVSDEAVKTVAIAEPKIADAAVGSERTVVVNGKSVGTTSLVVYGEGGRFRVYEVAVYSPNGRKQVALHVKVAEVNDNAVHELGLDFAGTGKLSTAGHNDFLTGGLFTTKVAAPSVPLGIGPLTDGVVEFDRDPNTHFQLAWRALEQRGDIRILANPTLVAMSGDSASFLAGGEFPIPVASSATAAGLTGFVNVTVEWKEFGIKLKFTPTVEGDGSITLDVSPEVSQLDFTNPLALNGFTVPTVNERKTHTTVHMNAGEHLVIGGLKQTDRTKTVKKVPILGDIPLINLFFSTTRTEKVDRELVIDVSPEMIEPSATAPHLPTDAPAQH